MKPQVDSPSQAIPPVPPPVSDPLPHLATAGIELIEREQIRDYLAECPDLGVLLPDICKAARAEFGPSSELSLMLYRDPEAVDQYLTLYIRQPKYEPEILARIERVSHSFEGQLELTSGHLLLTTDFRPPRRTHGV